MPAITSPGIYRITHKPSGATYVGGTKNIRRRWAEHRSMLGRGVHWVSKLQQLFDADGANSLSFVVIEELHDSSAVLEREQHWLDLWQPALNTWTTADSPVGAVLGPLSDAHKEKLAAAKRGIPLADWHRKLLADINRNKTPEHRANISAGKLGKRPSEATRAKMSKAKIGTKTSDEARRAISAALKGEPKSDAHRAALCKPKTPEARAAMSAARKKWWDARKSIT
jgi:group I intron endonuclease